MQSITLKQKRELVRAECARLGIKIEQRGEAFRMRSAGVDITVTDLSWVKLTDLSPDRFSPEAE